MRKLSKFYQSERERGVILSALMHLFFLFSILVGIPDMLAPPPPEPTTITVDILPISELTNIKPMDSKKPEPTTEPEEKKAPPTKSEEQAPPPPKAEEPAPAEEQKAEPAPDPLLKQKELEKLKKLEEEKKEKEKAEKQKKEKEKKEKEKAEKEKKEKEKKDKEFAALIDTLAKEKKEKQEADKKNKEDQSDKDDKKDKASKNNSQKYDDSMPMSISEKDAIMSQFAKYWNMPAGAKNAENLIVTLDIELRQDGVVLKVELAKSNMARYNSDSFFRAAADSAIRAVRLASPIQNLSPEKYQTWRYMELSFDPRQMLY